VTIIAQANVCLEEVVIILTKLTSKKGVNVSEASKKETRKKSI